VFDLPTVDMPTSPTPAFIAGHLRNEPGLSYLRHEAP
jgi:hypothetical protein